MPSSLIKSIQPPIPNTIPNQPAQSERRAAGIVFLSLSVLYIAIAGYLASLHAFWSSDCGARFAMILNWINHGSLIYLYYPASRVDPTGQTNGLAYFLYHQPHGFTSIYAPLYPFVTGIFYRIFGWYGLSIVPVLSGLGTLWLLYLTAKRLNLRCRLLLPLAAGLGMPLLIYSAVYWDHVTMMFLTALCAYWLLCALQENRRRYAAYAGVALGVGIFIHDLMLALSIAVMLASIPLAWKRDGRRLVLGLLAGFIPLALLWLGTNYLFYGNFAGPHMAGNFVGANKHFHGYSIRQMLDELGIVKRARDELIGQNVWGLIESNNYHLIPWFLAFGYAIAGYWAIITLLGMRWRFAPVLCIAISALAAYFIVHIHWSHALFLATPLVIPALAIPWDAVRKKSANNAAILSISPNSLFYAWISRACWLFGSMVLIFPMPPGVGWGNRFLLTMLPLLVILAAHAMEEQFLASGRRWQRVAAVCIAGVVGLSIFCQVEGLTMVYRNILYQADRNQAISRIKSPVLVFNDVGISADITAINVQKPQFLVQGAQAQNSMLVLALRYLKAKEFAFVGYGGGNAGLKNLHLSKDQYFVLKSSQPLIRKNPIEDGFDMQIDTFVLKAVPKKSLASP